MKQQLNKNSGEISGNTLNEPSNKSLSKKHNDKQALTSLIYIHHGKFCHWLCNSKNFNMQANCPRRGARFPVSKVKEYDATPFSLHDMDVAVARLVKAIKSGEQFAIFSDYDVDGATSSALLFRYFREFGLQPIIHIPDRA